MLLDFSHEVPTATGDTTTEPALEDEMQVKLGPRAEDPYHRFAIGSRNPYDATTLELRTGCGKQITGAYSTRDPMYRDRLCEDGCFSPYELKLCADANAAIAEQKRLESLPWGGRTKSQRVRLRREITQGAAEESRRLTTERMKKLMPDGREADDDSGEKEKP